MEMYTVYRDPLDYPGKFVVRRFTIGPGVVTPMQPVFAVGDSLEAVRQRLPEGLMCSARCAEDDPVIVETWF